MFGRELADRLLDTGETVDTRDAKLIMTKEAAGLSALQAPWRIGIDVGGTFTDLVLTDSAAVESGCESALGPCRPKLGCALGA